MSYSDLLQSYQDRVTSMIDNETNVGDYLLNKAQDKFNRYIQETGVPEQIGGVLEQVGILSNNSAVKSILSKSGLKGVFDEKMEALSRNVDGLKDQLKQVAQKGADVVTEQVNSAKQSLAPVLEQSQQAIQAGREIETQARAGIEAVQQAPAQLQAAGEEAVGRVQQGVSDLRQMGQEAVSQVRTAGEQAISETPSRLSPEYLQSLSKEELQSAFKQSAARKAPLRELSESTDLDERQQVTLQRLSEEGRIERIAYINEAKRRGLLNDTDTDVLLQKESRLSGISEEPNVLPSQINREAPQFEAPTQQLPQVQVAPTEPQPSAVTPEPEAPVNRPAQIQPESEIEPAIQEGEKAANAATKTETAVSDVAKAGTGLEEAGELPGIGEVTEVLGALLQIGSLIASAFKPHETAPPAINTPQVGFGFGALQQFGGSSAIV